VSSVSGDGLLRPLIEALARLPGIGEKSAERLAYHILRQAPEEALDLAEQIRRVKEDLRQCADCFAISRDERCEICSDPSRDRALVCVVEQPKDLLAIERSGAYRGLYHVLGGSFSPLDQRGPAELTIARLLARVREGGVREVIIATDPDFEGDGTALLIEEALAASGVPVTRLARGLPSGGQIEYMNQSIIRDAVEGRRPYGSAADPRGAG
jgi:recombination protein RecR